MNKKVILSSIFALCIATPAMAEFVDGQTITDENDPTELAQGMGCDQGTLGVTEGTANIEAIWNPNQITINWFENENAIFASSTSSCEYDGTLSLPQQPSARAGYTFGGWKIVQIETNGKTLVQSCLSVDNGPDCQNSVYTNQCAGQRPMVADCVWNGSSCSTGNQGVLSCLG